MKVVYQAGVNEKLLGDFIRKHNVRDKVFSECSPNGADNGMNLQLTGKQLLPNVVSTSSDKAQSPTLHPISRRILTAPSSDLALPPICTTFTESILVCQSQLLVV